MENYIEIFVTVNSKKTAAKIASVLLDKRIAACVQQGGPVRSYYEWQGKRRVTNEWTLTIKSSSEHFNLVEEAIKEFHPYITPEIIIRKIDGGSRDYLKWLDDSLI
jgi:periplasmic divalent cation tolerance protein